MQFGTRFMRDERSIVAPLMPRCYVCGSKKLVATHEIFYGTANRKKSIEDGMLVNLCGEHHNLSDKGVHFNKELDLKLKQLGQKKWEETYGDREAFIKRYGRSYLSDTERK